jgi:GT2 family glycosyltransferase/ADP-heptose:LPS heptosyltransferase
MVGTPRTNGGGNIRTAPRHISVRRNLAIGDVLCSTVVAHKLAELGFSVEFQSHSATHCILRRCNSIESYIEPKGHCDVDLDNSYERDPQRRQKHFHRMFMDAANHQLGRMGIDLGKPFNCTPRLHVTRQERDTWTNQFSKYPRPWVFICPRSNSFAARTVPDMYWGLAAPQIPGTKFWLGMHPAPEGIVDLHIRHLDNVILALSVTDLLLTTDTGPLHIAAALRTPLIALGQSSAPDWHLSDQNDFHTIWPEGNLKCLDCQENVCPISALQPPCQIFDPAKIAQAATTKLSAKGRISAAVSVYRPVAEVLNRCLAHLLPQVDEIVVCRDLAGTFPTDATQHPKIRYIVKNVSDIGYGRKQNYAVRHTSGEFVLLVNDDVFLNPGAVELMLGCMADPKVGVVSNLLRYPNGTIYHAGKVRAPNVRGWGHVDHRGYLPTFKKPLELENVCGACNLVRREAFYSINGFDETFFLYAEDDDMALSMRKNGWKLMFHPDSTGIHMEHQSTEKTPRIVEIMHESNRNFDRKWGAYLTHNATRIPGNFDYL